MNETLLEIMVEGEHRANRSCAVGLMWVAVVLLATSVVVGLTDRHPQLYPMGIWRLVMGIAVMILPFVAYARSRGYRGSGIKHLMTFAAALIPVGLCISSAYGFFMLALPLVVSARYFSCRFVWQTYAMCVAMTAFLTIPHAMFAVPLMEFSEETSPMLRDYLAGVFCRRDYFTHIIFWHVPAFVIGLGLFAIVLSRQCREHLFVLEQQAKVNARLADVEKGLFLAAASAAFGARVASAAPAGDAAGEPSQPDVRDWTTTAISSCIAKCKKRAAADSAFADLIARDPAAAVKEVGVC